MSPLPLGVEELREEIEFLENIDLELDREDISESVLFSNLSLEQNCTSPNVEYEIISDVVDVHEETSVRQNMQHVLQLSTRQEIDLNPGCEPTETGQEPKIIQQGQLSCSSPDTIGYEKISVVVDIHEQNEGDSMHAMIERKTKNVNIYTPEQWYMAMRMAKTDKPYEVNEISQESVFNFKACLPLFNNWKKGSNGQTVMWSQVCEVHVSPDEPFTIKYKCTFEEGTYQSIECSSSKNTRNRQNELTVGLNNIQLAYNSPLPLDKEKSKDLNSLCQSGIIPAQYHDFFKTLVTK